VAWEHDLRAEFDASVPTWGFASSPLTQGGYVIVQPGGRKGAVAAFDEAHGKLIWAAGSDPNGYSSPVHTMCCGVAQTIAVTGESILGIRTLDGEVLWRHPWRTENRGNIATPIVVGDYVFVSSAYGKGCVLLHLTRDGNERVKSEVVYFRKGRVMQNHHSTCVYKDGFLYGYDNDALRCVDLRKGEVVEDWNAREVSGGRNKGCVILAGDHLIGLTQTGTLYLADADPTEFRLRGKVEGVLSGSDCWALPVLVDGRLYLRDHTKVVCFDIRPK
jgi:outer membrane protein assembly factor BamB